MTILPTRIHKEQISGYAMMVRHHLDDGWNGHLMTFVFNQLRGDVRSKNHQMQNQIENVYASMISRLIRRPRAYGAIHPIMIGCPDFPVKKYAKKSLTEVITNDGLHYHVILLLPPGPSRLKVSVQQHFDENQSYYVRDQILNRIHVEPFNTNDDGSTVTDYALKGLKTNRLPDDETLLILPKTRRETSARPYRTIANANE